LLAWCSPHANTFLPSLRFHPILGYVRTLYNNKINEPNKYCQVRKSLAPGNGAPLHRVAPLQSLIRAPYQQTCCCCVAWTQRLSSCTSCSRLFCCCFFGTKPLFPSSPGHLLELCAQKIGIPWLIGRHGMSAGPIGDSLKHCAIASRRFQPQQAAASSLASHSRRSY
jgi:hypothetical protein